MSSARSAIVLRIAKAIYRKATTDVLTEEEAWRDIADSSVRAYYISLGLAAAREVEMELRTVYHGLGPCICRGEGVTPIFSPGRFHCVICGGRPCAAES